MQHIGHSLLPLNHNLRASRTDADVAARHEDVRALIVHAHDARRVLLLLLHSCTSTIGERSVAKEARHEVTDIDLTFLLSACCRRCSHAACPCCGGGISRLDLSTRSSYLLHPPFLLFGRTACRFVARFFFCSPWRATFFFFSFFSSLYATWARGEESEYQLDFQ